MTNTDEQTIPAPVLWISGENNLECKNPVHELAEILRDERKTSLLIARDLREKLYLDHIPNPLEPITFLIKELQKQEIFVFIAWDLSNKDEFRHVQANLINAHLISMERNLPLNQATQSEQHQNDSQNPSQSPLNSPDSPDQPVDLPLDGTADYDQLINSILDYIDKHQLKNDKDSFSSQEEEEVTDRLKNLGYI